MTKGKGGMWSHVVKDLIADGWDYEEATETADDGSISTVIRLTNSGYRVTLPMAIKAKGLSVSAALPVYHKLVRGMWIEFDPSTETE